jgi:hypothetical protein
MLYVCCLRHCSSVESELSWDTAHYWHYWDTAHHWHYWDTAHHWHHWDTAHHWHHWDTAHHWHDWDTAHHWHYWDTAHHWHYWDMAHHWRYTQNVNIFSWTVSVWHVWSWGFSKVRSKGLKFFLFIWIKWHNMDMCYVRSF